MMSSRGAKIYFGLVTLSFILLGSCTRGFESADLGFSKDTTAGSDPWSQATSISSSQSEQSNTSSSTRTYCSIYVPAVMARDQELRAVLMSQGLAKFQVSVNGAEFINLQTTNGSLSWAPNLFEAGTYDLKFRGLLDNNTSVACDPASKTVTIYASASSSSPLPTTPAPISTPAPSPSPGTPAVGSATVDRSYTPLVGASGTYKGFKDVYNPSNLTKVDVDPSFAPGEKCYQLSTRHWPEVLRTLNSTKYRVYIPPGTKNFFMTALTYYDATTIQALTMKLNSAPTATYEYVLANHPSSSLGRNALEQLFAGAEVHGYLGPNANVMPGFPGKGTGTDYSVRYIYKTPRGGWLYINHLQIIGGVSMLMTTNTCVDTVEYENWYRNAQWDSDGNPL